MVVPGERHLRHDNEVRTHLTLDKYAPVAHAVGTVGHIFYRPVLGGLHHQYVRIWFTTGTGPSPS